MPILNKRSRITVDTSVMSLTITLTGTSSLLESDFFPPIDLNTPYELGLVYFEAFHAIPNVDSSNNQFHYGDGKVVEIPTGSYEITDIEHILKKLVNLSNEHKEHPSDSNAEKKTLGGPDEIAGPLVIRANHATLKSELFCRYDVDFSKPNSIGSLLGFERKVYKKFKWHYSTTPIDIFNVNNIRVDCNITKGAYNNGVSAHTIHEFSILVPPGYKIAEKPEHVIYFPVLVQSIPRITVRICEQDGKLINFRGERVTVRLHLRPYHDYI